MATSAQVNLPTASQSGALMLPVEAGFVPAEVPGIRKAAILLVALAEELANTIFKNLSDYDVRRITNEITHLGEVPPLQTTQVLTEFYGLLETREHMVRGGADYAMKLLTESFGAERAKVLLSQVKGLQARSAGDLALLQKLDPQQLSKFLENEHPQTMSLVLAHLDSKRASTVLMNFKDDIRVDVVKRLAEMRQFSPDMAQSVAVVLRKQMESLGTTDKQNYSGFKAVAELLNQLAPEKSRIILEEIETSDAQLAIGIRNLMFTFEDLVTVPAQSMRELVGAIDKRTLALALKGAKDNLKAYIFKAMSSRAVDMLKEDMEAMGPVRGRDVGAAQQELLATARKLEAEGKIILKLEADSDLTV